MVQRDRSGTRQVRLPDGTVCPDSVHLYDSTSRCSTLRLPLSSVPRVLVLSTPADPTLHRRRHRFRGAIHPTTLLRVRRRTVGGADNQRPKRHVDFRHRDDGQHPADQLECRTNKPF